VGVVAAASAVVAVSLAPEIVDAAVVSDEGTELDWASKPSAGVAAAAVSDDSVAARSVVAVDVLAAGVMAAPDDADVVVVAACSRAPPSASVPAVVADVVGVAPATVVVVGVIAPASTLDVVDCPALTAELLGVRAPVSAVEPRDGLVVVVAPAAATVGAVDALDEPAVVGDDALAEVSEGSTPPDTPSVLGDGVAAPELSDASSVALAVSAAVESAVVVGAIDPVVRADAVSLPLPGVALADASAPASVVSAVEALLVIVPAASVTPATVVASVVEVAGVLPADLSVTTDASVARVDGDALAVVPVLDERVAGSAVRAVLAAEVVSDAPVVISARSSASVVLGAEVVNEAPAVRDAASTAEAVGGGERSVAAPEESVATSDADDVSSPLVVVTSPAERVAAVCEVVSIDDPVVVVALAAVSPDTSLVRATESEPAAVAVPAVSTPGSGALVVGEAAPAVALAVVTVAVAVMAPSAMTTPPPSAVCPRVSPPRRPAQTCRPGTEVGEAAAAVVTALSVTDVVSPLVNPLAAAGVRTDASVVDVFSAVEAGVEPADVVAGVVVAVGVDGDVSVLAEALAGVPVVVVATVATRDVALELVVVVAVVSDAVDDPALGAAAALVVVAVVASAVNSLPASALADAAVIVAVVVWVGLSGSSPPSDPSPRIPPPRWPLNIVWLAAGSDVALAVVTVAVAVSLPPLPPVEPKSTEREFW
jgi:hypothetical protein